MRSFESYLTEKSNYKIYIDMDGVLTDFVKHVKQQFGDNFKEILGDKPLFWELVHDKGEKYWAEIPIMSDAKKLIKYLQNQDIAILSSAGSPKNYTKEAVSGKKKWMKKHFPNIKIIIEYNKFNYANPKSILIDDLQKNIKPWIKAGGIGILHTSADDTIKQLKSYGV